jgi:hypothetical protein
MADQITAPNKAPACYLLGELYRRLSRDREAVRWYDRAMADPALPPDLRRWARQGREVAMQ